MTLDAWRRQSPLVFLFVTVFVDMIGYGIVVPLLPFYAGLYASGAVLVGLLGSLYAAMQFAGGPFLGGLSDRHGRRPVLLLCLLGTSLAYLMLGLAQTLTILVLAVVLAEQPARGEPAAVVRRGHLLDRPRRVALDRAPLHHPRAQRPVRVP